MSVWVLLLRGINVGGTGKLPMADLKTHMAALGAEAPETYIQSGNAVFEGDIDPGTFATALTERIEALHGHAPRTLVLPGKDIIDARDSYPFAEGFDHPKFANIWFCTDALDAPDLARLEDLATGTERFALKGCWFFLDAPDGIGRSKLAERGEKALGVPATARNLNTVTKLARMVEARQTPGQA